MRKSAFPKLASSKNQQAILILVVITALAATITFWKGSTQKSAPEVGIAKNLTIDNFTEFTEKQGAPAAYKLLKEKYPNNEPQAHDFAHIVGIIANDSQGMAGLSICDTGYNYGCYHGFIEAFFIKNDIEKVNQIEATCIALGAVHSPSCLHGIGHGVMASRAYDLNLALADCQRLQTQSQIYCWDGVFMERIVGSMLTADKRLVMTEETLNEPCARIAYVYKSQCWRNQVTAWFAYFQSNTQSIGKRCSQIEAEFQQICFESIGLNIAMIAPQDPKSITLLCSVLPNSQVSDDCLTGTLKELLFEGKSPEVARSLCSSVSAKNQGSCLSLFNNLRNEYQVRFGR